MTRMYDITRTVRPSLAVWPGDTPYSYQPLLKIAEGASVNLNTLRLSAHTGTHADSTYHYDDQGMHPSQMELARYIGPCQVVTVRRESGGIVPEDLQGYKLERVERLLLHTWYSDLPDEEWRNEFPHPTPALIDWLAERGCRLLGVDTPSVDHMHSKTLDTHKRMNARDMYILEILQLSGVPDGRYELVALPLKLDGVCGSPVRAILREIR
jgi:arylformamidase